MSEPTVTVVKDGDGNIHYYGSGSKKLREGLENGSLTPVEEVPNEAAVHALADDFDTRAVDDRPGDGQSDSRPGDRGERTGTPKPKSGR